MDTSIFKFDVKRLRAIPRDYLGFLIASAHCCNELAILSPYIIFEHDIRRANEFETAFILTRKFTIDRILISKIFEYGKLCSKFFARHRTTTDPFVSESAKAFEPIAAKIKDAKWAAILRNTISFHYDAQYALRSLDQLDDDHPLHLMAGRLKGLTLFEFAEEITSRPVFESAGNGEIKKGMDAAHAFITELLSAITTFHAQTTISLFRTHGMLSERISTKLHNRYCAAPGEVRIPISISSRYVQALHSKKSTDRRQPRRLVRRPDLPKS
jgi:hypothetical protein